MRAAVDGVDVVGEAEDGFGVAVVVLQSDFHSHAASLGFHVDGLVVQHLLAPVEVLDEFGDPAVVFEFGVLGLAGFRVGGTLVGQRDNQALVQKGQFAQPLGERVVVVFGRREDAAVRQKVNLGSSFYFGDAGFFQFAGRLALGIGLLPGGTIAPDFELKLFAEGVDHGNTNSVQSTRNLVSG